MHFWKSIAFVTITFGFMCELSFQLCEEFQILRNTIPINDLISLIERHYRFDKSFRRAMDFLNSEKFSLLAQKIEGSKQFKSMLAVFERAGVDASDIATIDRIVDCLLWTLPVDEGRHGGALLPNITIINHVKVNVHNDQVKIDDDEVSDDYDFDSETAVLNARTLQSFAMDVYRMIPRYEFRSTACTEARNNPEFDQFLKIVRSPLFQSQIFKSLNSGGLARILKKFRHEGIDAFMLLKYVFKIFALAAVP